MSREISLVPFQGTKQKIRLRHRTARIGPDLTTEHTKESRAQQTSYLAEKGEARPVLGYDTHDPHYPIGPADATVLIPDIINSRRSRHAHLPKSIVPVIDELVGALLHRDQMIDALKARHQEAEGEPHNFDLVNTILMREKTSYGAGHVLADQDHTVDDCQLVAQHHPYIIAVGSRKGGAGKTTTAVNIAVELASRGKRTLLVDLDSQGHIPTALGIDVSFPSTMTIHGILSSKNAIDSAVIPTNFENLSIIPSDPHFEGQCAGCDGCRLARELRTEDFASRFDIVVIDMPPAFDLMVRNALMSADACLIPLLPHPASYDGLRQMVQAIHRIAIARPGPLPRIGIVPVMMDPRIVLHRRMIEQAAEQFGDKTMLRGIRTDIKLAEAFEFGKPIRQYAPRSKGALDYYLLAETLMAEWVS